MRRFHSMRCANHSETMGHSRVIHVRIRYHDPPLCKLSVEIRRNYLFSRHAIEYSESGTANKWEEKKMDCKIGWSGKLQALKWDYLLIRENFPVTWCRLIWKCRVNVRHPMFCVRSLGMAAFCFRRRPKWIQRPNAWTETNDLRWSNLRIQYQFEWHLSSVTNVENQRHGPRCRSTSTAIETREFFTWIWWKGSERMVDFVTYSHWNFPIIKQCCILADHQHFHFGCAHIKFAACPCQILCVECCNIARIVAHNWASVLCVVEQKDLRTNGNKMNKIALRLVACVFIYVDCSRYTRPINNKCVRCCCVVGRSRTVLAEHLPCSTQTTLCTWVWWKNSRHAVHHPKTVAIRCWWWCSVRSMRLAHLAACGNPIRNAGYRDQHRLLYE